MNSNDRDDNKSVAIYWDFENLHAGLIEGKYGEGAYAKQDNRFKPQEPLIDVQALVELGASFGPVAINRAYCNWQFFGRYRDALLQSAVELIQLFPPGARAATSSATTTAWWKCPQTGSSRTPAKSRTRRPRHRWILQPRC